MIDLDIDFAKIEWNPEKECYEWIGDPSKPAMIGFWMARYIESESMPWTLERIWFRPSLERSIYIRTDTGMSYAYWRFVAHWWHFLEFMRSLKPRIILTAEIWGLAEILPGYYPEWSDIKFLRWLK